MKIFNLDRYQELFQKSNALKNNDKSFFHENPKECIELSSYEVMISDYSFHQNRFKYYALIKDFLELKIEQKIFISQFLDLYDENLVAVDLLVEDFEQLRTSSINSNLKGFSRLIEEIYEYWDNQESLEDQFREYVKNIFIDMQCYM